MHVTYILNRLHTVVLDWQIFHEVLYKQNLTTLCWKLLDLFAIVPIPLPTSQNLILLLQNEFILGLQPIKRVLKFLILKKVAFYLQRCHAFMCSLSKIPFQFLLSLLIPISTNSIILILSFLTSILPFHLIYQPLLLIIPYQGDMS